MKITFILPGIAVGGGVRVVFEHANRLTQKGHEVNVVYPIFGKEGIKGFIRKSIGSLKRGEWDKIKNYIINRLHRTIGNLAGGKRVEWFELKANLIGAITHLKECISERYIPDSDILVATWWETAYWVANYPRNKGKKCYFIQHYETWGGPEDQVNETYRLPLYRIVISAWLKEIIEEKFKVPVFGPVPNGVNFEMFYRDPGKDFTPNIPRRIGMMYSQSEWKGLKDGIKAFEIARESHPNIQLVLFGDSRGKDIPDYAEFHRNPSQDKLRRIYNSMDIFVMPSHAEGFGLPPMEAMACGVACVVTNVGAVSDYTVPGETALVSPPKKPEKLAENLIILLNDEKKRQQIAKEGHKHIKQFTWERATNQLERVFKNIIEGKDSEN